MVGEVLPPPSVHFVAHVLPLHRIVKLGPDYSGAGLIIFGSFSSFVEVLFQLTRDANLQCVESISYTQ